MRGASDRASRFVEGRGGFVCLGGSSSACWANLEKNSARGAWDGDDLPVSGAWPDRYRVFLLASSVHRVSSRAARRVLTGEKKNIVSRPFCWVRSSLAWRQVHHYCCLQGARLGSCGKLTRRTFCRFRSPLPVKCAFGFLLLQLTCRTLGHELRTCLRC